MRKVKKNVLFKVSECQNENNVRLEMSNKKVKYSVK